MTSDPTAATSVPTDHTGMQVLTLEECLRHLRQSVVGRVAFPLDGELAVLPVNHCVDGADICFRTLGDSKIQAAVDRERVAFEVDAFDEVTHDGWSVLVQGTAVIVADPEETRRLNTLGRRPWVPGRPADMTWIRVRSQSITGRALVRLADA
jgi:uncharacterized protein